MSKLLSLYKDERNRRTIEWYIAYESSPGETAGRSCPHCLRPCRQVMCVACWREALDELENRRRPTCTH